jgi:hypothetical protein
MLLLFCFVFWKRSADEKGREGKGREGKELTFCLFLNESEDMSVNNEWVGRKQT